MTHERIDKKNRITLSSVPHAAEELRHPPSVAEVRTGGEENRLGGHGLWQHIYAADYAVYCRSRLQGRSESADQVRIGD